MPSRLVRGEILTSHSLSLVSMEAELAFDRAVIAADDFGRLDARPAALKAALFPIRENVTGSMVRKWIEELASTPEPTPPAFLYSVDGREYVQLTGFERHRGKTTHRSRKFPEPPEGCERIRPVVAVAVAVGVEVEKAVKTPRAVRSEGEADLALADRMRASVKDAQPTWTEPVWKRERERYAKAIRLARESDGRSPEMLAELCARWGELPQQARAWCETHPMDWKRDVAKLHGMLNGQQRPTDSRRGVLYTGTDAEFEEMARKYGRADG